MSNQANIMDDIFTFDVSSADRNESNEPLGSIMILTDNFTFGGLETHIKGEVEFLKAIGWKVHLVCGKNITKALFPTNIDSITSGLTLDSECTAEEFNQTIEILLNLIQEKNITHIHSHPFIAMIPGIFAAAISSLPFITTLHGPSSVNGYSSKLYDFFMSAIVLPYSSNIIVTSEEIKNLASPYASDISSVITLPNAIKPFVDSISYAHSTTMQKWLIVGRLDKAKVEGMMNFITQAVNIGIASIDIAGDGAYRDDFEKWCLRQGFDSFVTFLGFQEDIPSLIGKYSGVAGMGRVILETLSQGVTACLVGYDGTKGIVDVKLFEKSSKCNFSGRNIKNISATLLKIQLEKKPTDSKSLQEIVNNQYSESVIWNMFSKVLINSKSVENEFILDLYHLLLSRTLDFRGPWISNILISKEISRLVSSSKYSDSNYARIFSSYSDEHSVNTGVGGDYDKVTNICNELQDEIKVINHDYHTEIINHKKTLQELSTTRDKVAKLNQSLISREQQLSETENLLLQKNDELNIIVSSKRHHFATIIANISNKILPVGTGRRMIFAKTLKITIRLKNSIENRVQSLGRKFKIMRQARLVRPSAFFDSEYYLAKYPDVRALGINPLVHYLETGFSEARRPSAFFDSEYYLAKYPDVRALGINPLVHYLETGFSEARTVVFDKLDEVVSENEKTPNKSTKPTLVFQIDSLDKGGVEEVVLSLISEEVTKNKFEILVFVTTTKNGHISKKIENMGIKVFDLNSNLNILMLITKRLNISAVNLHYSLFGVELYKSKSIATIYTIHNNYIWADDEFINYRLEKYRYIDSFIAVSAQVGDYFSKLFSIDKNQIRVIPNGASIDLLKKFVPQKRSSYGIGPKDFVFINVASFTPNKFHSLTIAALGILSQEYPDIKVLFVGNILDTEYYENTLSLIKKHDVSKNIKLIKFLDKSKLLGLLQISDCFILPSLTEGFSMATIEAMYSGLPLLLSDVGGAREVIKDNDIGLVIDNPYESISLLSPRMINENFFDDSCLNNLEELISAMRLMYIEKKSWRHRAVLGKKKVLDLYNSSRMASEYIEIIEETMISVESSIDRSLRGALKEADIAIIAPYPTKERVTEGWMSRISAIDRIVYLEKRIYVNFAPHHIHPTVTKHEDGGWEVLLAPDNLIHKSILKNIIDSVETVYVHTLHLAEYIEPFLSTQKIIVDFHGITPEEELMLGHPHLVKKYQRIERNVLRNAKACVMVTQAMRNHYSNKYPQIIPNKIIILPIVESLEPVDRKMGGLNNKKPVVIYSGGSQAWQNVDAMLDLASSTKNYANYVFLSHDWENIKEKSKEYALSHNTIYEYCDKSELPSSYARADFGLVLRDDNPVNRVACPTKLYEYLSCGLIPIVRTPSMGDFLEFGYEYINEIDFKDGLELSSENINDMIENNYRVVIKMQERFGEGINDLRKIIRA